MVKIDQMALKRQGRNLTPVQWHQYQDSVLTQNKMQVEFMFNEYGFWGINKVGKEASKNFSIIVQHSDKYPVFQRKVLKAMKRGFKKGNAIASDYAYLYDRVEVNAGRMQLFGTQVNYNTNGRPFPKIGLIDSANIDNQRKAYKLKPLKDYYEFLMSLQKLK
jgi:hypothetical protein